MSENKKQCPFTSIGGQALLEGIMMKGPGRTVMATRLPEGNIELEEIQEKHLKDKFSPAGWPIIRGCVNMVESLLSGYKALMKSAEKLGLEEDDDVKDSFFSRLFGDKLMSFIGMLATVLGVGLAVVLFMWLPTVLFNMLNAWLTPEAAFTIGGLAKQGIEIGKLDSYKGIIEGVIKILIFVGYVAATALMKDIKRTYQYHGGEHKCIFCYEQKLPLTVENVRKQSRFHPRCGTSFLILILLVSILVSSSLILIFPTLKEITWLWVAIKILVLPLVMGFGYELIRVCGRHNNWFTRLIAAPGLWVQRLTTKEPEDDMIEVAIAAMEAVIPENQDRPLSDFVPATQTEEEITQEPQETEALS